ncbi:MAG: hypothetical protein IT349_02475 [Candidatus Eisenbacteria bacterium]|nr:hypothetical protein [Candidatus Eisenbacteria bacterium]
MQAASSGDTVRIDPGTYYESVRITQHSLVIRGSGPDTVILPAEAGSSESGSAFWYEASGSGEHVISDLTVIGGTGTPMLAREACGGAIAWACWTQGGALRLERCAFVTNTAMGWLGSGGAVFTSGLDRAEVENVVCDGNVAEAFGGGLHFTGVRSVRLDGLRLIGNDSPGRCEGNIMWYGDSRGAVEMTNCEVTSSPIAGSQVGTAVELHANEIRVSRCSFVDLSVSGAAMRTVLGGVAMQEELRGPIRLLHSTWQASTPGVDGWNHYDVTILDDEGDLEVARCAFVGRRVYASVVNGPVTWMRNVMESGALRHDSRVGGRIECSVFHETPVTRSNRGSWVLADTLVQDPLFCDVDANDLRVREGSPCVGGVCGQIGPFGVGCAQVPVHKVSWGMLKRQWEAARKK